MPPREIAARALGIEPSSIASVEPIKHGLTNESWLVRTASDAVVVRTSSRHWASLQIDRNAESIVLAAVAAVGIGPPVIACDLEQGILVTRYLGATCEPEKLHESEYVDRLGRLFRKLHQTSAPRGMREIHLPTVIAGYLATLRTLRRECALADADVSARGSSIAAEIAGSSQPRLCHNDVHHLNLIDSGGSLRLIDWEYAGIGEPFFDLASACVYHDYSLAERERLLDAYLAATPSRTQIERLAKCCWLFEYVRDLWTEVRAAVDTR